MPELPEVETMVRGLRPHLEGATLVAFAACRCGYKPISIAPPTRSIVRRTVGRRVERIGRLGKRVLIEMESGDIFVIEPRMTGLMLLSDPPDREHLRFQWSFSKGATEQSLWFWDRRGLGTIRLFSQCEFQEKLGPSVIGPDALKMKTSDWRDGFRKTGRAVKVALLDQRLVAGIGNIYASEILHLAEVHPMRTGGNLSEKEVSAIARATRKVLNTAIRYEGSTLADGTYRNALNRQGRYQNVRKVYARQGETCSTCGRGEIQRIVLGQRATFFCPVCQPAST